MHKQQYHKHIAQQNLNMVKRDLNRVQLFIAKPIQNRNLRSLFFNK
jgi:hypothetical protein